MLALLAWLAWQYLLRDRVEEEAVAPTTPPATVGEPAQNLVVDDVNLGQEVTSVFENATAALSDVTDAASAEAALPKLNEIDANLDRLGGLAGRLPAEGKSALAALINGALPELEALIARVSDIPGVGDNQASREWSGREAEGDGRLSASLTPARAAARAGSRARLQLLGVEGIAGARSPVLSPPGTTSPAVPSCRE